jgi:hypothetical protein
LSRLSVVIILSLAVAATAAGSPLFDGETAIDVVLTGPLGRIGRDRQDDERIEYPFTLTIDGKQVPVNVRVRGRSRTVHCSFPPLRLRFDDDTAATTPFSGQDKLKLVTHCRNDKAHFENNVLDEFVAYRIFNVISDAGYRVRLLRVRYEDTDKDYRDLDRAYYAFVVESERELAARLGGTIAKPEGVLYSQLDEAQTALMSVFQYLIANSDWSFVRNPEDDECCHNVDLIEAPDGQLSIPRDFDLSGLVNASYAKPPPELRIRRVTTRKYRGYCRSSSASISDALDHIVSVREEINAVVASSVALSEKDHEERVTFVNRFFEEAVNDRDKLLDSFDEDCIGHR